ncbi:DapH/DapD/GlmU-related protein [Selenomonas sp. oral taxon 892]|uniref:acyltransferase n=1 Tax=Selenomonas sp. oral taxon 892 TaxID=1321785 RepID=UPI0006868B99|nr:acyltransferase [Selenomonas sp. oral taxon 892]
MKKSGKFMRYINDLPPLKELLLATNSFFRGYIVNHIIAHIPCELFRWVYYRFVVKMKMDRSVFIYMGVYLYPPTFHGISIGKNTAINRNVILDWRDDVYIGNNVNISAEAAIYTGGHRINSTDFAYYSAPVRIEDRVWIGTRAMIMPGVTIGEGAVILPGAVVTQSVPPFSLVGGVPGKVIGTRQKDLTYDLTYRGWFL